ncbi:hypothetical protein [Sulfuritalea hydrogenivorans]|uniref:Alkaline phytoceramidase n=1 Tax=Sulfuritalea hydrogenivorans sk43H TaxID=1223802 RepID=W0SE91_9PROT|nr:hypothetical protein [Sulfuritalea hydrogenivorans]MDK9713965.1 hypothetical protein [Sulfuritalea sp.]BAO28063.1 hypothetical protein SUTH_00246 [Sulfuritalea hydrogenivorans sk43H]
MRFPYRHLPVVVTALLAAAALLHGPIAQPESYHHFADQKVAFGIPHFADVISNLGFAAVAVWGWIKLAPARRHPDIQSGWAGYSLFLIGLFLTGLGSSWYHLAPDNAGLVWDRLPIAVACGGLLAGVRGDVRHEESREPAAWLALVAIVSVGWWYFTDLSGRGDLRPYLLLQGLPILLIPLWQWIYRQPASDRLAFGAALTIYVGAKFAELNDHEIAATLGVATGHTLKHLLATGAAALIVGRLANRVQAPLKACADAIPPAPPSAMNACR